MTQPRAAAPHVSNGILPVMHARTVRADLLLLITSVIWGAAFVAQRSAMQHMGPWTFNGIRFALGTLVLLPLVARSSAPSTAGAARATNTAGRGPEPALFRGVWPGGLLAGLVLFVGASLQQSGLQSTAAGKAGFITGLYVLFVPLLGLLIGNRTPAATWAGAMLAAVGLYLLSISGKVEIDRGDLLVLGCAVAWGVHVLLMGRIAPRLDPLRLAAVQFAVTSVLSVAVALVRERATWEGLWAGRWELAYGGFCSVGIAYTLQVVGQRSAPPAHAALLMSLEAVFAAASGWWLLGERLGARELAGCALMFAGIVVSQLGGPLRNRRGARWRRAPKPLYSPLSSLLR